MSSDHDGEEASATHVSNLGPSASSNLPGHLDDLDEPAAGQPMSVHSGGKKTPQSSKSKGPIPEPILAPTSFSETQ